MPTIWGFDHIENKHTLYRGKDCMKKFCDSLREHASNIIDFEKKKNVTVNKKWTKSHQDAKVCYICRRKVLKKFAKDKNYRKVRDRCHYRDKYSGAVHSICNLKFNAPIEVPVVFHRGSIYDYNFVIKELANEFEGKFELLGENKENYKTFSIQKKNKLQ